MKYLEPSTSTWLSPAGTPPSPRAAGVAAELVRLPNLLSLVRLPLAALFPFVAGSPVAAVSVLALGGLSDVLDGYVARRTGSATSVGAIVDPLADKVFSTSVGLTLLATGRLPLWALWPLLARELVEAPLALLTLSSRRRRAARVAKLRPNLIGKAATFMQFTAFVGALVAPGVLRGTVLIAGAAGLGAGLCYGVRELRAPVTP